MNRPSGN
ncbi:hypothetical protein V3C99_004061 [Haemonchus contortus]